MISRSVLVGIFVLLTAMFSNAANQPQRSKEDQLVHYLLAAPKDDMYSHIRSMSSDEKAAAIRAVRENKSGAWAFIGEDVLLVLMFLGDPEERKKAINDFRRQRFNNAELVKLGEPWVIEELAPEMFREEEYTNLVQGDIFNNPLSYGVAGLIIANLQNATIYSDEVLQWAKRTSPHALPQLRAAMRDWWRENERFFKEKNYKAVRPGRDVPMEFGKVPAPPPPEPPANRALPQPNYPPAAVTAPASAHGPKAGATEAPGGSVNEPTTPSLARLIIIAALALAMLWAVFAFAKTRR